jgi:aminotransferase
MSIECDRVGGLNLSQGVCDMPVPEPVRRAAQEAVEEGNNIYTRYDGIERLRQGIAAKLAWHNGLEADPATEIIATAGATGALYSTCLALLDPGDEMILFEPYYGYHRSTLEALGIRPAYVRLSPPDWRFDPADLDRAATPKTRAILVNTPANPTGKVFSRAELESIAEFAKARDCFVFTDEIYEHFLCDGRAHVSPATLPGMRERTVTISGLSKTFSITGWRIGYAVADAKWARRIGYCSDLVYVCAASPLQVAVAAGLELLPRSYYAEVQAEHQAKRDRICAALRAAGLPPHVPQGAYYVMADLSRLPGRTGKERAMRLLERTKVACVPGDAFFHAGGGESLARFCYAKPQADLEEACRRLEALER